MGTEDLRYDVTDTPIGPLWILLDASGALRALGFDEPRPVRDGLARRDTAGCRQVRDELAAYFTRSRRQFSIPLAPQGTAFQQSVWRELQTIPYGATCSYKNIADALGKHTSPRAVGAANAANPIAVVIPCHRVIGADGSLTGYAGGLERKQRLLALEGAILC